MLLCLAAIGQANKTDNIGNHTGYENAFIRSFKNFKMNIQAAEIASIPATTFDNDTLIIEYAYFSEGENRKGKMALTFNTASKRYGGNWQTNADNGNVYKGWLYSVFSENGEFHQQL